MNTNVVYLGMPDDLNDNHITVRRTSPLGTSTITIGKPLKHYVLHSASGFSWGFGGSGPAETARCVLIDFLGLEPKWSLHNHKRGSANDRASFPEIDNGVYQSFKCDIIAKLPQDSAWQIAGIQIAAWLEVNPLPNICSACRRIVSDHSATFCTLCKVAPKESCYQ